MITDMPEFESPYPIGIINEAWMRGIAGQLERDLSSLPSDTRFKFLRRSPKRNGVFRIDVYQIHAADWLVELEINCTLDNKDWGTWRYEGFNAYFAWSNEQIQRALNDFDPQTFNSPLDEQRDESANDIYYALLDAGSPASPAMPSSLDDTALPHRTRMKALTRLRSWQQLSAEDQAEVRKISAALGAIASYRIGSWWFRVFNSSRNSALLDNYRAVAFSALTAGGFEEIMCDARTRLKALVIADQIGSRRSETSATKQAKDSLVRKWQVMSV